MEEKTQLNSRPGTRLYVAGALLIHAMLFAALAVARGSWPSGGEDRIYFSLPLPAELPEPLFLVASAPNPASLDEPDINAGKNNPGEQLGMPAPGKQAAPDEPTPAALDEETMRELEADRERLRAEVKEQEEKILAGLSGGLNSPLPKPAPAMAPTGTVRQLDMSGWPQSIVDGVMSRYRLRTTQRMLTGPTRQSFLSSISTTEKEFKANRNNPAGLYTVFELTPEAVSRMSRLEEDEIVRRKMDPAKTIVRRVVFGIVETSPGVHDLGVLDFEAEEFETSRGS